MALLSLLVIDTSYFRSPSLFNIRVNEILSFILAHPYY